MNITNKTKKPLKLPLPDGKRLFLGPGKSGQITAKYATHPPLVALIEAGEVELDDASSKHDSGSGGGATPSGGGQGGAPSSNIRRTGDR